MIKGWLVYRREDLVINQTFAQALIDYGRAYGLEVELLELEALQLGVQNGALVVMEKGTHKQRPQFVINRTRHTLFAYQLEQMGIRVFNQSRVTEICNHKGKTHQLVAPLNIPMVDTLFFDKSYMTLESCSLDYPLVIKSPAGHGGKQVYMAQDEVVARKILEQMEEDEVVIQSLCNRVGVDVRVFVLGDEILGAICRSSDTDFRSNYSLGGKAKLYTLSDRECAQVKAIQDVLCCDYVGIDFMLDKDGAFVFNEVEDVVGSRTLYQFGNVDVAKHYMAYINEQIKREDCL